MESRTYHAFPNTHWSLVGRAAGGIDGADAETRREALAVLLARYMPALRSYLVKVRRMDGHEADDLLQAFVTDRLLEGELLRTADAGRGRFRTLLLTSLNRFAISRHRKTRREGAEPLAEDAAIVDGGRGARRIPGAALDAEWARVLVHQVIEAMREQCAAENRADVWAVFDGRLLAEIFGDRAPASYEELARTCRLSSPAQAANLLVTAKRMYTRLLREAVGEYEREAGDVEAELSDLRAALAGK